jgi:uncharacterized protein (DUF1800 family)
MTNRLNLYRPGGVQPAFFTDQRLKSDAVALIDAYAQPLSAAQAAHLLRRATFGPTPDQIKAFTGLTPDQAVQRLLTDQPTPPPPVDPDTGKTFHDQPWVKDGNAKRFVYVKSWWLGQMLNQPATLLEKMALFWSNHFVTNATTVNDYRYMYQYLTLLRQQALGNFRTFTVAITQNPAMLRFLNGNQNVAGKPNENYARELQELFTMGRGGGYTEDDVRTAARVLTGWADTGYRDDTSGEIKTTFRADRHDTGDKTFSAAYQNTTIKGRSGASAGLDELNDLADMILRQPETAKNICRKLYRWFVNSDITPAVESGFISPLAEVFRANNFEFKPVLTALFRSQHFYDDAVRAAIIKAPADLVVGTLRFFGIKAPDLTTNAAPFYQVTNYLYGQASGMQQNLLDPPNVFGWTAYYLPDYYQQWINATTLGLRGFYTDSVNNGTVKSGSRPTINPLPYVKTISDPSDPATLVNELTAAFVAVPLSAAQRDFLTDTVLLNGLPRYEWGVEWNDYAQNPGDAAKMKAVQMKLNAFLQYLCRMAEFQLC